MYSWSTFERQHPTGSLMPVRGCVAPHSRHCHCLTAVPTLSLTHQPSTTTRYNQPQFKPCWSTPSYGATLVMAVASCVTLAPHCLLSLAGRWRLSLCGRAHLAQLDSSPLASPPSTSERSDASTSKRVLSVGGLAQAACGFATSRTRIALAAVLSTHNATMGVQTRSESL